MYAGLHEDSFAKNFLFSSTVNSFGADELRAAIPELFLAKLVKLIACPSGVRHHRLSCQLSTASCHSFDSSRLDC